ncbi:MAG: hypothetical protein JNK10_11275 [Cyclobacteriaceae bacterium]|nr:hypothetical protein [Cyclobacteriaceae bacterium]
MDRWLFSIPSVCKGIIAIILTGMLILPVEPLKAQSTNAPLDEAYYHWIDRYEVKSGAIVPELFTTVKPYKRSAIIAMVDSLQSRYKVFQSAADQFNLTYLHNDSWEWSRAESSNSAKPFLKALYRKKSDFYMVDEEDIDLHINPVLYLGAGKDSRLGETVFTNARGFEIRGMIDKKIGFYTFLTENQARLPLYATEYSSLYGYNIVPHTGFYKTFKGTGVDYFEARGYIDFNISKHIWMQFGHDRTFIGTGYRSLIYSDFAPPSQFLRANVKIWKLNYLFQLSRMTANNTGTNVSRYPDKYMAFHHLSVNIGKKLNLGLFESVMFSPQDSINGGVFELSYLNPVIFYRAIEQQNGSADNVILGLDWKWLITKGISFYGQFVLDEFVLSNITSSNGWWGNKYALQGGIKYIDVAGIQNLDLQLEGNVVRPFTFSHENLFTNYAHFLQPIGHPMGANFYEIAGIARYQPMPRLSLTLKSSYLRTGRDNVKGTTPDVDWGGDINKSYTLREQDYNNKTTQGTDNTIVFADLSASYMLRHNLFLDFRQTFRNSKSADNAFDNRTTLTSVALRWNIAARLYDF